MVIEMTEYDELRKNLLELEQKLVDSIAECYMKLNAVKYDAWPKVGNTYFYITAEGECILSPCDNDHVDNSRKASNNCYRTREEAEAKAKWLSDQRTEARFRLEQLDGFDVNGYYAVHCHKGLLYIVGITARTAGIRFTTEAQAEYAKTHHAADLMLVLTEEVQ